MTIKKRVEHLERRKTQARKMVIYYEGDPKPETEPDDWGIKIVYDDKREVE